MRVPNTAPLPLNFWVRTCNISTCSSSLVNVTTFKQTDQFARLQADITRGRCSER